MREFLVGAWHAASDVPRRRGRRRARTPCRGGWLLLAASPSSAAAPEARRRLAAAWHSSSSWDAKDQGQGCLSFILEFVRPGLIKSLASLAAARSSSKLATRSPRSRLFMEAAEGDGSFERSERGYRGGQGAAESSDESDASSSDDGDIGHKALCPMSLQLSCKDKHNQGCGGWDKVLDLCLLRYRSRVAREGPSEEDTCPVHW